MDKSTFAVPPSFARSVKTTQARLVANMADRYDFIVCGAGSSGSVIARRLAENPDTTVLLVEAGGDDEVSGVIAPEETFTNMGSARDWGFVGAPGPEINLRSIPYSMGKVLGGGSSINFMAWVRGHREDWDHYAAVSGDDKWNYQSALDIYRRIEDWQGDPDPDHRGVGGPVFVGPAADPNPVALAFLSAASGAGMPIHNSVNGRLMEEAAGCSIAELRIRDGRRQSVFRSYTYPFMDRPNLTVLTHAEVRRLIVAESRVLGVEICHGGSIKRVDAGVEVIVSLGAINTPKVLMQSGIGDEAQLRRLGIAVHHHLPGVGRNFQDHVSFDCVWEYREPEEIRNTGGEALMFGTTASGLTCPDVFAALLEVPYATPENVAEFGVPEHGWTLHAALTQPKSRGEVRLSGPAPEDPVIIDANTLGDPEDLKAAIACVEWCREVGNADPLRHYVKREVMPAKLGAADLERFVRNAATTFFHQTGTAKMGRDEMSVVDSHLAVYGLDNLRVADGSILPRITTTNTMAPCVVVGERAAAEIKAAHGV
jgi:choline dehydrogenase